MQETAAPARHEKTRTASHAGFGQQPRQKADYEASTSGIPPGGRSSGSCSLRPSSARCKRPMKSLLNTPPRVRNSRSASRRPGLSRLAHLRDQFVFFRRWTYRFLSAGSPGWILFWIPSRPAIIRAENTQVRVGQRIRGSGFDAASLVGSHVWDADRSGAVLGRVSQLHRRFVRNQTLVGVGAGLVMAFSALACLMMPPM